MKRFDHILRGGLYRSRHGVVLGVCRGIADFFDLSVFWIRFVAVAFLILSGFWPITALYFVAALIMKPEPIVPLQSEEEHDFYDSYIHSRSSAIDRIRRRYENLERRIQRMEHTVTSREFDWEKRLNA